MPTAICRSARSFMSTARRQPTRSWSILCGLPCRIDASSMAASRLFAAPMAWMSPVKWRLRSSIGTTCVMPPPAAPPLMPNTGPSDGSRRHATGRLPIAPSPWVRPTSVVVFPSPAFVGVMPVTQISFPSGRSASRWSTERPILALKRPYGSISSGSRPQPSAICSIGMSSASCAISRLLFISPPRGLRARADPARGSMADGCGGEFRHEVVLVEALEPERLDEVGLAARVDQLGERLTDDRRGLEPVSPPAGADVEVLHLGLAEDRRVIRAEVAQARPCAQDARVLELWEEIERVAHEVLQEVQRAAHAVRRPRLDLRSHHELAAVGLRDVDVHLGGDDHDVEQRLERLRHPGPG